MDMEATARKITIGEVLTVHGTHDRVIPVVDAQAFSACIRQHQLFLVEGADHNYTNPLHADACVKKTVEFIAGGV